MSAPFYPIDMSRVAEVLDMLGHETEELGTSLCADPDLVARHLSLLQSFDRIAQYQRALAKVLRAECMTTAARNLELNELVAHLLE